MHLNELLAFKDKETHIIGLSGAEGTAVLRLLDRLGFSTVVAHDRAAGMVFDSAFKLYHVGVPMKERIRLLDRIKGLPIEWRVGERYLTGLDGAELVFLSQGWYLYPENLPAVDVLRARGARLSSMTELYFDLTPCPIIGVTGSNGKSTTTKLIDEILGAGPIENHFAGNDRQNVQVLHEVLDYRPDEILLLEISNRQLKDLEASPHIAVITNLTPDHISEHGSFEAYVETKAKIVKGQSESDFAVLNYDDPLCREIAAGARSQVYFFSTKQEGLTRGAFVKDGDIRFSGPDGVLPICGRSAVQVPGEHNLSNVLAAAATAALAGAGASAIAKGIREFSGKALRMQLVAVVDGVEFYNDVKSTTPHATIAALSSFSGPVVLIAGGEDKGLDYGELAEAAAANVTDIHLLPGSGSDKIVEALAGITGPGPEVHLQSTLEQAVRDAFGTAKPGTAVLLSPACASFYSLYMQSPKKSFGGIVKELQGGA
ncbi:MAG: UDP-N-acetylmuramoyl-L-alanine--D-glutamate ligase [Candidatus Aquicultorales bacterium]